jgi:hypothetical protein
MATITFKFSAMDPVVPHVVSLLRRLRAKSTDLRGEVVSAERPPNESNMGDTERNVRRVWAHLRTGTASREYLTGVANFCASSGTAEFTLNQIASFTGKAYPSVKAANRNAHRGMKAVGVALFQKHWDPSTGHMKFSISTDKIEAIQKVSAEDVR